MSVLKILFAEFLALKVRANIIIRRIVILCVGGVH